MQLSLFDDLKPEYKEGCLTKTCRYCKEELPIENFQLRYKGYIPDGIQGRNHICNTCFRTSQNKVKALKDKAPAKPINNLCQCCGVEVDTFFFDHCHETEEFRGWLCRSCNVGIGFLGDDIEGVEKALAYLQRYYDERS